MTDADVKKIRARISEINDDIADTTEYMSLAVDTELQWKMASAHIDGLKEEREGLKEYMNELQSE